MPQGVRDLEDHVGADEQVPMKGGDVLFFMDGAQTHGTLPWHADHPRRTILFKFAGRYSSRTGPAFELAPLATRPKGLQTHGSKALSGGKAGRSELWGILEWPDPYREPFRKLLVHPVVVSRLTAFCGKGFRQYHGPWLKGTDGATLHGAGDGGFCIVPGSHKSNEPKPDGLITMEDNMGLVVQPEMNAGDVVFFAEAATHGTLPWNAAHDRRSLLYKYTERAAARDVGGYFTPQERYGDWVNELTLEQKAVLYGPGRHTAGKPLPYLESDGKKTWSSGEHIGQDVRGGTVKKS